MRERVDIASRDGGREKGFWMRRRREREARGRRERRNLGEVCGEGRSDTIDDRLRDLPIETEVCEWSLCREELPHNDPYWGMMSNVRGKTKLRSK